MMMKDNDNQVLALGTGTSTGIPMLGCKCEVCLSDNPKNRRFRTSIALLTATGKTIIVDTGPDLRSQLLANGIDRCDACIVTHEHADHTHGIDDLRPLSFETGQAIALHTGQKCAQILRKKFPYIFDTQNFFGNRPVLGGGIPKIDLLEVKEKAIIAGEEFEFFLLPHGHTQTLSFRHRRFAYVIDCESVPNEWIQKLKAASLDLLILDCVKREPHQTHLHLEASLEVAQAIGAKRTGLIHMGHELEHEALENELKNLNFEVFPLYDGQRLSYSN